MFNFDLYDWRCSGQGSSLSLVLFLDLSLRRGQTLLHMKKCASSDLQQALVEKGLDHTLGTDMEGTLADPVKIRQWQVRLHSIFLGVGQGSEARCPLECRHPARIEYDTVRKSSLQKLSHSSHSDRYSQLQTCTILCACYLSYLHNLSS